MLSIKVKLLFSKKFENPKYKITNISLSVKSFLEK
jgi:hypothetical protein